MSDKPEPPPMPDFLDSPDEPMAAKMAAFVGRSNATRQVRARIVARHSLRRALRREPSPAELDEYAQQLYRRTDTALDISGIAEAEVREYLDTDETLRALSGAIVRVGTGLTRELRETHGLTPRERETLRTFGETHSIKETAHRMGIKVPTVKAHLKNARVKTDARDSWEAVDKNSHPGGIVGRD